MRSGGPPQGGLDTQVPLSETKGFSWQKAGQNKVPPCGGGVNHRQECQSARLNSFRTPRVLLFSVNDPDVSKKYTHRLKIFWNSLIRHFTSQRQQIVL